MSSHPDPNTTRLEPTPPRRRSRPLTLLAVAGALILAAAVGFFAIRGGAAHAAVAAQTNCSSSPSSCGFPDSTNTGVPSGTTLKTVPGDVSSGPGWAYDSRGFVNVTGDGAVLSGLNMPFNVNVAASNVTLKNDKIVVGGGGVGVSLRHATGATIEHTTISGQDAGSGRMMTGVKDVYGDSSPQVLADNISLFETGVQVEGGLIQGNYIHDPGFIAGDHTNGVMSNGGKTTSLTINHNTVLNSRGQTDAISLFEDFGVQANRTITNNLIAGGGYTIYGGQTATSPTTSNIVVQNNRFGVQYYPKSGNYGPVQYFNTAGSGNVWSGNVWDNTGDTFPP